MTTTEEKAAYDQAIWLLQDDYALHTGSTDLRRGYLNGFQRGAAWQRKQPIEITDEMVERACIAFTCDSAEEWFELAATYRASIWSGMHAALEAALNGGKA